MSEEELRRALESATKNVGQQSYEAAAMQYEEAAKQALAMGDNARANQLFEKAASTYIEAGDHLTNNKRYRGATSAYAHAAMIYEQMKQPALAKRLYLKAAQSASKYAEDLAMFEEYDKAASIAVAAGFIYILGGDYDTGNDVVNRFRQKYGSKVITPDAQRILTILDLINNANKTLNVDLLASAENITRTEFRSGLVQAKSDDLFSITERAFDIVRENMRSKIKLPKVIAELEIPIDLTFKEAFTINLDIKNVGEGEAKNITVEFFIPDGLQVLSGNERQTILRVNPNETQVASIKLKATTDMVGEKAYSFKAKVSYMDILGSAYSIQVGPVDIVLRDYKESEKLTKDVSQLESKLYNLKEVSHSEAALDDLLMDRIINIFEHAVKSVLASVSEKDMAKARSKYELTSELVELLGNTINDANLRKQIADNLASKINAEKRRILSEMKEKLNQIFAELEREF